MKVLEWDVLKYVLRCEKVIFVSVGIQIPKEHCINMSVGMTWQHEEEKDSLKPTTKH